MQQVNIVQAATSGRVLDTLSSTVASEPSLPINGGREFPAAPGTGKASFVHRWLVGGDGMLFSWCEERPVV